MPHVDDVGAAVSVPSAVRRVVSLVPSLTESIAESAPGLLVGATDWCTHPPGLAVARVRGTKNPDLDAVIALAPDVVLANEEENRASDLTALRAAGLAVWVTAPRSVPGALDSLRRMLAVCGVAGPDWLTAAERTWAPLHSGARRRAIVPIWRRPWMALGSDTFAGDVLDRLGVDNVLGTHPERYPRIDLAWMRAGGANLVVLPDEPYAFGVEDLDAVAGWDVDVAFVSGRHLTWYGPSLTEARDVLNAQLAAATRQL